MIRSTLIAVSCICLFLIATPAAEAAKCVGSSSCRTCTNCSRCGYCKSGGSCGACRSYPPPTPRKPIAPATPEPKKRPESTEPVTPITPEPITKKTTVEQAPVEIPEITVLFSSDGGCTDAIAREIGKARVSILVTAYHLTSRPIATALADAKNRNVDVTVILDGSALNSEETQATFLHQSGISVFTDSTHGIQNDKVIVVDDRVVITGSFTYAEDADAKSAENLLIIKNAANAILAYKKNGIRHLIHSDQFTPAVGDASALNVLAEFNEAVDSCCEESTDTGDTVNGS